MGRSGAATALVLILRVHPPDERSPSWAASRARPARSPNGGPGGLFGGSGPLEGELSPEWSWLESGGVSHAEATGRPMSRGLDPFFMTKGIPCAGCELDRRLE